MTEATTLISWSMAKSITHALLGIAMVDGLLDVNDPAPFAPLQAEGQPPMRWIDLLEMRSGLTFVEDYEDASVSHCLEMLFSGEEHRGVADMGMYAALSAVNSGRESIGVMPPARPIFCAACLATFSPEAMWHR